MTKEDILEGNKLIAKFDTRLSFKNNKKNFAEWVGVINGETGNAYMSADLKFHSSWDWLMPVVEKIEDFNDGCTLCIIEDERCHINTQNGFEIDSVGHTKIEAVYNAVVEFIKWYNDNIQ